LSFIPTKIKIYKNENFYFVWEVPNALWASIQALHLGALIKPTCDTNNQTIEFLSSLRFTKTIKILLKLRYVSLFKTIHEYNVKISHHVLIKLIQNNSYGCLILKHVHGIQSLSLRMDFHRGCLPGGRILSKTSFLQITAKQDRLQSLSICCKKRQKKDITFMHLVEAFIQRDLQMRNKAIRQYSQYSMPCL